MDSKSIRQEIQLFQTSVKKLSVEVGKVSSLWKDDKFNSLLSSVVEVANQSKNILLTGDRCCSSIDKFEKIASEKI